MVQFNLPKNSRPTPGKTWPKPANAKRLKEFRIYRWNPDEGVNPRIDTYYVDRDDANWMKHTLAWIDADAYAVILDYRPVHAYTMTNDVAYVEPKARVY